MEHSLSIFHACLLFTPSHTVGGHETADGGRIRMIDDCVCRGYKKVPGLMHESLYLNELHDT